MVEAGGGFLKYSRRTWWIFSKCSMLRTYPSTRQMSSIVPPAASTAAFRFSHTWRGLRLDVADAGDRAVGAPRGHAGDEHQLALRLHRNRVREVARGLADLVALDLLFHVRSATASSAVITSPNCWITFSSVARCSSSESAAVQSQSSTTL